ncbi:MAG: polysaccharide pyruvyl transferase family protein [Ilumatobacteraceae bacterium]
MSDRRPTPLTVARVGYGASTNAGDAIQSLALENAVGRRLLTVDRQALDRDCEALRPDLLIVNGWYDTHAEDLAKIPPWQQTRFVGLRIDPSLSQTTLLTTPAMRQLFSQHPVGCRDRATFEWFDAAGIAAWWSGCVTSTLPLRARTATQTEVLIVDVGDDVPLPDRIRSRGRHLTHALPVGTADAQQMTAADDLLRTYRDHAALVVTTRLHAALPCVAMGVPVVLFAPPKDTRFTAISMLGVRPVDRPVGMRRRLILAGIGRSSTAARYERTIDWRGASPERTPTADALSDYLASLID